MPVITRKPLIVWPLATSAVPAKHQESAGAVGAADRRGAARHLDTWQSAGAGVLLPIMKHGHWTMLRTACSMLGGSYMLFCWVMNYGLQVVVGFVLLITLCIIIVRNTFLGS